MKQKARLQSIEVNDPIFVNGNKRDVIVNFLYYLSESSIDAVYIKLKDKTQDYIDGFTDGLKEDTNVRQLYVSEL